MLQNLVKKLQSQDWINPQHESRKHKDSLLSLGIGDRITFGSMEQQDLSRQQMIVGTPTLFHFTSTQLESFPLFDQEFNEICHLIVAQVKDRSPYLAISKKIETSRAQEICTFDDYERIRQGQHPQHLYVRKHTANLQDWLHLHYVNKIREVKGTKIYPGNDVKQLTYSLYVAREQFKAIEIERMVNGDFELYATIFRPCSDITDVRHAVKPVQSAVSAPSASAFTSQTQANAEHSATDALSTNATEQKDALHQNGHKPAFVETPLAPREPQAKPRIADIDEQADKHDTSPVSAMADNTDVTEEDKTYNEASAKIFTLPTPVMSHVMPLSAMAVTNTSSSLPDTPSQSHAISCNLRMASKLIDEAMRSDMRVTDVIRKALGLKVTDADTVRFDLKLSAADYAILAKRFDTDAHDTDRIHEMIMEELGYFTGEEQ